MALKALMLRKKIDLKKKERSALEEQRKKLLTREAELEKAINEVTNEEEEKAVQEDVDKLTQEKDELTKQENGLDETIKQLETELAETEAAQDTTPPAEPAPAEEGGERSKKTMNTTETRTRFFGMTVQQRDAFFANENVKEFLARARNAMAEKRAIQNVGLTIPEVMLDIIRHEVAHRSRLLPFVNLRHIGGTARQNIIGNVPEAVWMEACGKLNELDLGFNQVEADGYQIGGYIPVCNATLQDSDVSLAEEILNMLSGAIAKGIDKAILFGDGIKKPIGIVTRLAQTSQPASWGANAPAWTDLHTSNIKKINISNASGEAFFAELIEALGVAKPWYNSDGLFWCMNRKTHLHILTRALKYNSAAALVANTEMFPIIGGSVIEFEDNELADYEIIGGFGGNYLAIEREGAEFSSSDQPLYLNNQTVFKGWARYDGMPLAGEAFVIVNYANTDPETSKAFPIDYANTAMNDLTITAAAGSTLGQTVLTVSGTVADSNPVLKYKLGVYDFDTGDTLPAGFATLTSGTTAITAAAGKKITVVELDSANRVISEGTVISVPKTA